MKYEGIRLTRANYKSVLEGYDEEILDIVELCLKDGTDIGNYIARCQDDSYRLWEIRRCVKEGMPRQIYDKIRYPKVIQVIRKYRRAGYSMNELLKQLSPNSSEQAMMVTIQLVQDGFSLKGYDLSHVADSCLSVLSDAIRHDIDLKDYINKVGVTNKEVLVCIETFVKDGKDITCFAKPNWSAELLKVVLNSPLYDNSELFQSVLRNIDPTDMNPYYLEQALLLCSHGVDPKSVFSMKLTELIVKNEAIRSGVAIRAVEGMTEDGIRVEMKKRQRNVRRKEL